MKIKNIRILLVVLFFGITQAAVSAQTGTPEPENANENRIVVRSGAGVLPVLPLMFDPVTTADLFNEKAVKNSPLAAEFQSETVRILPDNSPQLVSRVTTLVYRDKDGRTRREQKVPTTSAAGQPTGAGGTVSGSVNLAIEIYDPISGYGYTLYPATRTAVRYKQPEGLQRAAHVWDKIPQDIEITSKDRYSNNQTKTYKIAPPVIETLAGQSIQGVQVLGKRFTSKIPMNAIGNDLEVETVHEVWYAPGLKMLVKSSTSNAQSGEHTFQLTRLSRADQPAALFQVPADYRVVEMGAPLTQTSPN